MSHVSSSRSSLLLSSIVAAGPVVVRPDTVLRLAAAPTSRQSLREGLRCSIREGDLPPGARLLPGNELARLVGVGRSTASAAVLDLVQEGFIECLPGGAKVVKRPPVGPTIRVRPIDPATTPALVEYVSVLAGPSESATEDRVWKAHVADRCVAEVHVRADPRMWTPPSQWTWDTHVGPDADVRAVAVSVREESDRSGGRWVKVLAEFERDDYGCSVRLRLARNRFVVELS